MHGEINNLVGISVFPLRGASWTVLPYISGYISNTNGPIKLKLAVWDLLLCLGYSASV